MQRRISILGSTGSIGENALRIVAEHPDRFEVAGLAAGKNWERLAEQARLFRPRVVSVAGPGDAERLKGFVPEGTAVLSGEEGLREVAAGLGAEIVVSALVGAAGLAPTLAAIEAGASIALANKEVLVMAGELVTRRARARGAALLPVDSEHAGIAQALLGRPVEEVRRLVLTASGGPFRGLSLAEMGRVTPEEALRHPTWKMGPKVTVDSATMMNKGLEVIEAHWLFGLGPERVDVVVHPQSIVHAMVEFVDGSLIAQMSIPDMRIPIAQALSHPERIPLEVRRLNLVEVGALTFEEPDPERFPCLCHAKAALQEGGTATAVLNAANEEAVAFFLARGAGFMDIPAVVGAALDAHAGAPASDLESVLSADRWAREFARTCLNGQRIRARRWA
ncbi:MAG: 1-deoxy-D-xylulose-5-phosphate reductoisomerase [Candidatus Tectomicrobia bacterium]|nr:1-deoxy-D-xylulose-5-phosphate reductoisomerase [Candidatus Tectomicrobia bacterium]